MRGLLSRRSAVRIGGAEVDDARRLADAERALGGVPDGCAWLDARTVEDLDLPLVFRTIDRTSTPSGAQVLWRWLAAPAQRLDVIAEREERIERLASAADRDRLRRLVERPGAEAPHLPRLLWEPPPPRPSMPLLVASLAVLVSSATLGFFWAPLWIVTMLVIAANVLVDDWANLRLAHQASALEVLGDVLGAIERLVAPGAVPAELAGDTARDLAAVAPLRKRIRVLTVRDPLNMFDLVRGGLLVRLFTLARCADLLEEHRARLRRLVLWVGELDAMISIAALRADRADARVAELGGTALVVTELVHPAVEEAIGNDLALDAASLLVTGSNMSGKSTFLRAVAINAILAQSIHTTFGSWRAPLVRVHSVMRIADDTEAGQSKFAVEVAAIGEVLAAVDGDGLPALLVLDEPFGGTNPAIRVPIVVAVLDHLAVRHIVLAATHDLDVAAQVGPRFQRGYFADSDDGSFDRKLRAGIAPSTNAVALLRRAGYPAEILERIERQVTTAAPAATPSLLPG